MRGVTEAPIDPLRGLLDVARAARSGADLRSVLDTVAHAISRTLGYRTVVINLRRAAWDDFEVVLVLGSEEAREMLLGVTRSQEDWDILIQPRFERHGAYVVRHGDFDWGSDRTLSYVPPAESGDDPDAWHPEDALFVPLAGSGGKILGFLSVDEPFDGRRPSDDDLEVLVAMAAHVAIAVENAQAQAESARHNASVEHLLRVSAQLNGRSSAEETLSIVCAGISEALGFEKVILALKEGDGRLHTRASAGWTAEDLTRIPTPTVAEMASLLDPSLAQEGCILLDPATAQGRAPGDVRDLYASQRNGRGPQAWNRHWLLVPLYDREGAITGLIWADDPADHMLPSRERLQSLRTFANQAIGAIESLRALETMRQLAEHDPLTGLRNRRNFELGIEQRIARGAGRPQSLLVCDLDHFKRVNDSLGHEAGDEVLRRFARVLETYRRSSDMPTRLGGEEFALVLADCDPEDALSVAERLRHACAAEFERFPARVSVSVGVATTGAELHTAADLTRAAYRALWAAKRLGRDRSVVYHEQTLEMLDALRDEEAAAGEQLAAAVLLAETLDMRDVGTARHCETVGHYAEQIALKLGFPAARVARVRAAGVLHDIGKLGISDGILHKPGKLDAAEWAEMRRHPEIGARILEHANLRDIADWVRSHHERVDGRGYPAGLSGEQIPVEAKILAVADSYEAMTADRPYRRALAAEVAHEELRQNAGGQFDPDVVDAFVAVLAEGSAARDALVGVPRA
jgi:diguanylate cyclase (GGDEF)-like protein/putative nucleotidyltransferase with HDIG domain